MGITHVIWVISILCNVHGSRLPKFVDDQINNQINEGIRDELIPLRQVSCYEGFPINCFILKEFPKEFDWISAEFQITSNYGALRFRYKLMGFRLMPERFGNVGAIFETRPTRPDPIVLDLILDISEAKETLADTIEEIYLILVCDDCTYPIVEANNADSIGFIILRKDRQRARRKRTVNVPNVCTNNGYLERCCVNKKSVGKELIFENATKIIAPNTIPVSYCTGNCYLGMFHGNHNYALMKYYNSLIGPSKADMLRNLPCCSAKEFRDLQILYDLGNGVAQLMHSRNFLIDRCTCE